MTTEIVGSGATRRDVPDLPDYAMVGPYRLLQQLGEGGMGVVHLALDPHGKAVAIKVLRPHIAHDADARARLSREVETLGRLDDPRIAAVLDADIDGDQPYIVTRYVPGPSLDDVVRETGPIPRRDLHRLGSGLAEALHVIHRADVIHRDLKPGNVLLLDGDPVLIDFGIAHIADDVRLTMTGMVMGTPGYLSPEVVEGDSVTEATDWWGWAATLAFAASGTPPFGKGPMEAVLARVSRGEADLSRVDPALAPLLAAALSPEPWDRPDDRVVVDALERYAAGQPVTDVLPVARTSAASVSPPTEAISQSETDVLPPADPLPEVAAQGEPAAYEEDEPTAYEPEDDDLVDDEGVQPWPGTMEDGREGDPRIGRVRRSGTLIGMLALAAAAAAVAPFVAVGSALLWSMMARSTDRSMTSLVMRRHEFGRRRSDMPVAVVSSPWHLVVGVFSTIVSVVLPAVIGVSAAFCTALVVANVRPGADVGQGLPLGVGMLFASLMAWWGPGGASLRRGSRSILRGVSPTPLGARLLATLLVLGAAAAAAAAFLNPDTLVWWPLPSAPPPFDRGGIPLP